MASLRCNNSRLDFEDLGICQIVFYSCIIIPEHRVVTVKVSSLLSSQKIPLVFLSPKVYAIKIKKKTVAIFSWCME